MSESEREARLKELLKEVESVQIPDYPDYQRGRKWAVYTGVPLLVILLAVMLFSGPITRLHVRLWDNIWTFASAALVVLVVWAFGAFRPQKF
ncbi:hypothetical protein [Victivallis vadensis]|jgi:hypothetical protein|uniref:Uncharacterized protein n=1 Tax=Victivallis vadensis TaxID=172901 RepID=A0A2U1B8B0_9BACT|nr:hypothetical protein [Victivallis vadensis]NMD87790.1 hypothetical protein [Victivallis vadensis]PVY44906.1 hypothetical protein C8D82_10450 [Victivallis vadensis]HJH02690.1 hypothetical protein [Victivallis vadensis]